MMLYALVMIVVLEGGWSEYIIDYDLTTQDCNRQNVVIYNGHAKCVPMSEIKIK